MRHELALLISALAFAAGQVQDGAPSVGNSSGTITVNGKQCPANPDGSGASSLNNYCCIGKIGGKAADAYWSSFSTEMAGVGNQRGTDNDFERRSPGPTPRAVLHRRDVTTIADGVECTGFAIPLSASDYDAQVSSFLAGNTPAGSASTSSSADSASSSASSSAASTSTPASASSSNTASITTKASGSASPAATSKSTSKSTSSSKAAAATMTGAPAILGYGAVAAAAMVYGAM